jgi:hypothetical protein
MHCHNNQQNHWTYHKHQNHDHQSHTTLPSQPVRTAINVTLIRIIKTTNIIIIITTTTTRGVRILHKFRDDLKILRARRVALNRDHIANSNTRRHRTKLSSSRDLLPLDLCTPDYHHHHQHNHYHHSHWRRQRVGIYSEPGTGYGNRTLNSDNVKEDLLTLSLPYSLL